MNGRTATLSVPKRPICEDLGVALPFLDDISGTIRGYRIFTACRTLRGKIFRLEDHLQRLYHSASGIYMQPPLARKDLRHILAAVRQENRYVGAKGDLLLYVIFSGGLAGSTMKQSGSGAHLYIAVRDLCRLRRNAMKRALVWRPSPIRECIRT